jgi:hypothetical protein
MKILTYNLSWESMTGQQKDWIYCNNDSTKSSPKFFEKCINNMVTMIDNNAPYDFVALQEASNYKLLLEKSNYLEENMDYRVGKSGRENIITFWDPTKYKLIKSINGSFQVGRPWTILIFQNGLCFINLHAGHYHFFVLMQKLASLITIIKNHIDINTYRIIMAGDFNNIINENYTKLMLARKKFFVNERRINTIKKFKAEDGIQFDHVIDTKKRPIEVYSPKVANMASDHLPIITILSE